MCCICFEPIEGGHVAEDFKANYKLLTIIDNNTKNKTTINNSSIGRGDINSNEAECPRHPNQIISYFCKACNLAVCVDCMYDQHNGHILTNVQDMSK